MRDGNHFNIWVRHTARSIGHHRWIAEGVLTISPLNDSTISSDSRFTAKARQSAAPGASGACAGSSLRNTRYPKIWERAQLCPLRQMHWSSTGKNEIASSSIPKYRPIPSCDGFVRPPRGVIFPRVSYATPAPESAPVVSARPRGTRICNPEQVGFRFRPGRT